jgi:hypothetical protein
MRGYKTRQWEKTLKTVFDEIDHELESQYADHWPRHPSRPAHGTTGNPESDGLFNVGAAFSAGFGSKLGPGYTVEIRLSTLKNVSDDLKTEMKNMVMKRLNEKLPAAFPGKNLRASEDNNMIRIHGDLSLDG